jgi:hypothetical protein
MNDLDEAALARTRCAWWLSSQCAGNPGCWCRLTVIVPEPERIPERRENTR